MKKFLGKLLAVCFALLLCLGFLPTGAFQGSASAEGADLVDFTVEVETGRDIRVLQLSDTQLIDSAQTRVGREGVNITQWDTPKMAEGCYRYIQQVVDTYDPDLILITGDLIYGEFDDNGTSLLRLITFMESFEIPWAPVFGNHDNESARGADWQCEQLENAEHCLFKQRDLTGNGNYSVGLVQGGKLVRVFYMLDSNGCGGMSAATIANGHSTTSVGFFRDQIAWYTQSIKEIKEVSPDTKYSFACHIQPIVFSQAMAQYGYDSANSSSVPIDVDNHPDKKAGDFGYMGRVLKSAWDHNGTVWESVKTLGVDSWFVGHEHCNNSSVVYDGVRLAYGLKTGLYDRANYKSGDSIVGSYSWGAGEPIVGGTAIVVGADGAISNSYHVYYDNSNPTTVDSRFTSTLYASFQIGDLTEYVVPFQKGDGKLPYIPEFSKVGYKGEWNEFTMQDKDFTVTSTSELITCYATFVADGVEVAQLPFTVEDRRFKKLPQIPKKEGYTAKWEAYDLSVGTDITINAIYTKIGGEEAESVGSAETDETTKKKGCKSSGVGVFGAVLGILFVPFIRKKED